MNKFKKLVCIACAILCCFGASGNVLAEGYEASLSIEEHCRSKGKLLCGFDVTNDKGVTTYFVNIFEYDSAPKLLNTNPITCRIIDTLLDKCKKGIIPINNPMRMSIDKDTYIKFFNLTKTIKSKKVKDLTSKQLAFDLLVPEALSLFGLIS